MNRKIIVFLIAAVVSVFAQEKMNVTLQVYAPTLSDSEKIFVAGNTMEIGNWDPSSVQLEKTGKNLWGKTFQFLKGFTLEYKFTKGAWQSEALKDDASVPLNSVLKVENDTTISVVINNWRDRFNFKVAGQITGKVEYNKNFVIDGLKPRNIFVWLPPNYEKEMNKRYPVFYMHDGQNLIDPRTSNTFIDWQVDETADSLIQSGKVEPFIIVGINNTDDRGEEYNHTPLGKLYAKLIVEKIKPFVDKNYRTLTDAKNTAVGGSSMGGLISMICAWEYPNIFSKAACFSPAFLFRGFDYTKVVKDDTSQKKDLLLYIDNGGVGLETVLQPGVDEMIKTLKEKGYEEEKDFFVFIDSKAEHNEATWAKRIWRPIILFFGK